jgi:hypothetical protein
MSVVTYSYVKDRNTQLTAHLKVSEFKSYTDTILIESELPVYMEKIRDKITEYFGIQIAATIVNTGYRTAAHDRAVGGSGSGPHTTGKAADFYFRGANGKALNSIYGLCAAQLLGIKGIERISDGLSIHIDVNYRSNYWWAWQYRLASGAWGYGSVSDFFTSSWAKAAGIKPPETKATAVLPSGKTYPAVKYSNAGSYKAETKIVQLIVGCSMIDGIWGYKAPKDETERKVRAWQAANKDVSGAPLVIDGWWGVKCWEKARALGLVA